MPVDNNTPMLTILSEDSARLSFTTPPSVLRGNHSASGHLGVLNSTGATRRAGKEGSRGDPESTNTVHLRVPATPQSCDMWKTPKCMCSCVSFIFLQGRSDSLFVEPHRFAHDYSERVQPLLYPVAAQTRWARCYGSTPSSVKPRLTVVSGVVCVFCLECLFVPGKLGPRLPPDSVCHHLSPPPTTLAHVAFSNGCSGIRVASLGMRQALWRLSFKGSSSASDGRDYGEGIMYTNHLHPADGVWSCELIRLACIWYVSTSPKRRSAPTTRVPQSPLVGALCTSLWE